MCARASSYQTSFLPEKYKSKIVEAHEHGSHILRNAGLIPEPLETAFLVEEHRWFWKPEEVKFILVAESHVYTSDKENKVKIKPNKLPESFPKNGPLNFAKLVYCLGYGEPNILDSPEEIENNPGTKQYIALFKKYTNFYKKSRYMTTLEWKSQLLNTVKEKGIWLLDASLHACAFGKKERLPNRIVEQIIPIWWNKYVKPVIEDTSMDEESVWIIGKGVHDFLWGKYIRDSNWIYQPNARFKKNSKWYNLKKQRESELLEVIKQKCQI